MRWLAAAALATVLVSLLAYPVAAVEPRHSPYAIAIIEHLLRGGAIKINESVIEVPEPIVVNVTTPAGVGGGGGNGSGVAVPVENGSAAVSPELLIMASLEEMNLSETSALIVAIASNATGLPPHVIIAHIAMYDGSPEYDKWVTTANLTDPADVMRAYPDLVNNTSYLLVRLTASAWYYPPPSGACAISYDPIYYAISDPELRGKTVATVRDACARRGSGPAVEAYLPPPDEANRTLATDAFAAYAATDLWYHTHGAPTDYTKKYVEEVVTHYGNEGKNEFVLAILSTKFGAANANLATVALLKQYLGLQPEVSLVDAVASQASMIKDETLKELLIAAAEAYARGDPTLAQQLAQMLEENPWMFDPRDLALAKYILKTLMPEAAEGLQVTPEEAAEVAHAYEDLKQYSLLDDVRESLDELIKSLNSPTPPANATSGASVLTLFQNLGNLARASYNPSGASAPLPPLAIPAAPVIGTDILLAAVGLVVTIAVIAYIMRGVGRRIIRAVRERYPPPPPPSRYPSPRDAVITLYWHAVGLLSRSVPRAPSETHWEYLRKVRGPPREPLKGLTARYEVARYSPRELSEEEVKEAYRLASMINRFLRGVSE